MLHVGCSGNFLGLVSKGITRIQGSRLITVMRILKTTQVGGVSARAYFSRCFYFVVSACNQMWPALFFPRVFVFLNTHYCRGRWEVVSAVAVRNI